MDERSGAGGVKVNAVICRCARATGCRQCDSANNRRGSRRVILEAFSQRAQ